MRDAALAQARRRAMGDAHCDACHQRIVQAEGGLQCACQCMPWDLVRRFWVAYGTIPEPWPVLDTLDVMAEALSPVPEKTGER